MRMTKVTIEIVLGSRIAMKLLMIQRWGYRIGMKLLIIQRWGYRWLLSVVSVPCPTSGAFFRLDGVVGVQVIHGRNWLSLMCSYYGVIRSTFTSLRCCCLITFICHHCKLAVASMDRA